MWDKILHEKRTEKDRKTHGKFKNHTDKLTSYQIVMRHLRLFQKSTQNHSESFGWVLH